MFFLRSSLSTLNFILSFSNILISLHYISLPFFIADNSILSLLVSSICKLFNFLPSTTPLLKLSRSLVVSRICGSYSSRNSLICSSYLKLRPFCSWSLFCFSEISWSWALRSLRIDSSNVFRSSVFSLINSLILSWVTTKCLCLRSSYSNSFWLNVDLYSLNSLPMLSFKFILSSRNLEYLLTSSSYYFNKLFYLESRFSRTLDLFYKT